VQVTYLTFLILHLTHFDPPRILTLLSTLTLYNICV